MKEMMSFMYGIPLSININVLSYWLHFFPSSPIQFFCNRRFNHLYKHIYLHSRHQHFPSSMLCQSGVGFPSRADHTRPCHWNQSGQAIPWLAVGQVVTNKISPCYIVFKTHCLCQTSELHMVMALVTCRTLKKQKKQKKIYYCFCRTLKKI